MGYSRYLVKKGVVGKMILVGIFIVGGFGVMLCFWVGDVIIVKVKGFSLFIGIVIVNIFGVFGFGIFIGFYVINVLVFFIIGMGFFGVFIIFFIFSVESV